MVKDYQQEHELIRQELWIKIACAYVNSSNSTNVIHAEAWADKILNAFDNRFKAQNK